MVDIVGLRFRKNGQIHFYTSGDLNLKRGDFCWAETCQGPHVGEVVMASVQTYDELVPPDFPEVMFPALEEDINEFKAGISREERAFRICHDLVHHHDLAMKLVKCKFIQDGKKVIFFFTAEGRVDFRSLLKDLAREFKIRIELRQIGVRDEAKILGGLASCGRTLCCATWIDEFRPVSIKMAKQQKLSLDPQKISGICGRLKCCLAYEADSCCSSNCKKNTEPSEAEKKGVICSETKCCGDVKPYDPPL